MKYFTFLLFFSASMIVSGQSFLNLGSIDTSIHWYAAHDNASLSGVLHTETGENFLGHDTTIRGVQYWQTYTGLQKRFFRSDAQQRVYGLDPNDTVETLLYDFDAQVGDTIRFHGYIGDSTLMSHDWFYAIDSIDSMDIGGALKKAIHVTTDIPGVVAGEYFRLTWIDGIGEQNYGLRSVFVSDLYNGYSFCGIYKDTFTYVAHLNCYQLTGIAGIVAQNKLRIYPTPATNGANIENNTSERLGVYTISSLSGQILYNGNLNGGDGKSIDLTGFAAGMYVLVVADDRGNTYKQKLIKK